MGVVGGVVVQDVLILGGARVVAVGCARVVVVVIILIIAVQFIATLIVRAAKLTCAPGPALDVADAGHVQPHVPIPRRAAPVSAAGAAPRVTRGQGGGGDTHARPVARQIRLDTLVLHVPGAGLGVVTPRDGAVVHTLVHQTPELVAEHRAVAVVEAPDVLLGAGVLLQGVIAPGHTDKEQEAEEDHDGDGVKKETWVNVSLSP